MSEFSKKNKLRAEQPIVYSCSGCSNNAQLANQVAVEMDREGHADMSCIAGVGGGVKPLVKVATSGRKIIAIDGCPLQCVKHCLAQYNVKPTHHFVLTEGGLKKKFHADFKPEDVTKIKNQVIRTLKKAELLKINHN